MGLPQISRKRGAHTAEYKEAGIMASKAMRSFKKVRVSRSTVGDRGAWVAQLGICLGLRS